MLDALGHAHRRPGPLAPVVGAHGGVQGGEGGFGVQQGRAAEDNLYIAVLATEVDRAAHWRQRPLPVAQGAIDQVIALLDGLAKAIRFWNVGKGWVKPSKHVFHSASLELL
ncbi:hypothetical protein D3C85_1149920 [compost metagenome]